MGAETSKIPPRPVPRAESEAQKTEMAVRGDMGRAMPVGHMPEPHVTWNEVTSLFADNKAAPTNTYNKGSIDQSTNKCAPPIPDKVLQELYRGEGDRYGKPLAIPGCVIFEEKNTETSCPSIARSMEEEQVCVERAAIEPQGESNTKPDTKRDEVEGYSRPNSVLRDPYDSRLLDEEDDSDCGQIGRDRDDESEQGQDGGHGPCEYRDSVYDVGGPSIDRPGHTQHADDDKSHDQHFGSDINTADRSFQTAVALTASETRTTADADHQMALRPSINVAPKMITRESAARSKAEALARKANREAVAKKQREAQKAAKRTK